MPPFSSPQFFGCVIGDGKKKCRNFALLRVMKITSIVEFQFVKCSLWLTLSLAVLIFLLELIVKNIQSYHEILLTLSLAVTKVMTR